MPGTNLFPEETEFTPRPAWQVIEAARRQYLTGELTLHTAPTTRVYMRDGMVYYAERSTDGTLAVRLMMEGVITRDQMQRGTVIVNGVEHVGRMFDVDPTIDRSSVELCAELFTDDVMVDAANRTVKGYELVLYRRHPSGIDRWYAHTVPVVGRHNEVSVEPEPIAVPDTITVPEVVADVTPAAQAPTEPEAASEPATEPEVRREPEVRSEPEVQRQPAVPSQPKNRLSAPPITLAVPVTRPVGIGSPPAPLATQQLPLMPLVTTQMPVTKAMTPPPQVAAPPTVPPADDVDASTIADEVAEAIKRAFAGMGGGH